MLTATHPRLVASSRVLGRSLAEMKMPHNLPKRKKLLRMVFR